MTTIRIVRGVLMLLDVWEATMTTTIWIIRSVLLIIGGGTMARIRIVRSSIIVMIVRVVVMSVSSSTTTTCLSSNIHSSRSISHQLLNYLIHLSDLCLQFFDCNEENVQTVSW